MSIKTAVATKQQAPVDTFDDDTAYEQIAPEEFEPGGSVTVDSFVKDTMCIKCGMWKSEHEWDACRDPNFV